MAARVVAHAANAHEPGLFTTSPVLAIRKVLHRGILSMDDVDLFEESRDSAMQHRLIARDMDLVSRTRTGKWHKSNGD